MNCQQSVESEIMENINKITEMITRGGVAAVLLVIVLYFGNTFILSMTEMQKELATIRVEIQKLQDSVITTATVEKMIDEKIKLLQYKFHNEQCKKK